MQDTIKPVLIFTWGNPSRGDDALGTQAYNQLLTENLENVELLTDFQLQIEHVVDLENRERVLFVDASVSATAPFEFYRLQSGRDDSFTTHAMSPESLLATYETVNQRPAPPAYMLSIRGYEFDLGLPVSGNASHNLDAALVFIRKVSTLRRTGEWERLAADEHARGSSNRVD